MTTRARQGGTLILLRALEREQGLTLAARSAVATESHAYVSATAVTWSDPGGRECLPCEQTPPVIMVLGARPGQSPALSARPSSQTVRKCLQKVRGSKVGACGRLSVKCSASAGPAPGDSSASRDVGAAATQTDLQVCSSSTWCCWTYAKCVAHGETSLRPHARDRCSTGRPASEPSTALL